MKKSLTTVALVLMFPLQVIALAWLGVDFNRIDWARVCTTVEPMVHPKWGCQVVHPAAALWNNEPSLLRTSANCDFQQYLFEKYSKHDPTGQYHGCRLRFEAHWQWRVLNPDNFLDYPLSIEQWREKYLADGVTDSIGHVIN